MTGLFRKKWKKEPISRQVEDTPIIISSLEELRLSLEHLNDPTIDELRKGAKNLVFASGDVKSPLMIIGEAPGATEDEMGQPFVGRSGQLLTNMLKSINIDRNKTYITNVVNWRPPENRPPTLDEIQLFKPILHKHIRLKNPKVILALGTVAMKALDINGAISLQRGTVYQDMPGIKIIVSFHPSYLLRREDAKILAKKDLELLKGELVNDSLYDLLI